MLQAEFERQARSAATEASMTDTGVTRVLTVEEAFDWLTERGELTLSVAALAEAWGWPHRQSVYRTLDKWARDGVIERRGNTIRVIAAPMIDADPAKSTPDTAVTRIVTPGSPGVAVSVSLSQQNTSVHNDVRPVTSESGHPLIGLLQARTRLEPLATVLALTSVMLAGIGMVVNARFAASFGQSPDASVMLAALGLAADVLALVLLTVGCRLWSVGRRPGAMAAWSVWLAAVSTTLLATLGWSSTNIGDAIAGRTAVVDRQESVSERLHRLGTERRSITELRPIAELNAALAAAQGATGRAWDRTRGCTEIPRSDLVPCLRIVTLREAKARAEHRDQVDREIADLEARLVSTPTIGVGDPGAAMVSETLPWLTGGVIHLEEASVRRLRVLLLTCLQPPQGFC
jgi:hypothetical protein